MSDQQYGDPPPPAPRVWDETYQREVSTRVRELRDELATVDGASFVVRALTDALRYLPPQ